MQKDTTHCILLKSIASFASGTDMRCLEILQAHFACNFDLQSVATIHAENHLPMHHVYLYFEKPQTLSVGDVGDVGKIWHGLTGHNANVSRLVRLMERPGIACHEVSNVHYVVETDPEEGWRDEIFRWYDQEHMLGLAEVPGAVLAQRFLNLDNSPLSFACYDLTHAEVLKSPEWLAVRASAWSDICRPHFTNTLRTLFETVHTSRKRN